jgi:hypothetical protein
MLSSEYLRDLTITIRIILLLSGVLVLIHAAGNMSLTFDFLVALGAAYLLFAAGPFAGWILAAQYSSVVTALWSLIPLTFFSIWPAVRAAQATDSFSRRSRLALAGLVWLFSSFFYVLLIWT